MIQLPDNLYHLTSEWNLGKAVWLVGGRREKVFENGGLLMRTSSGVSDWRPCANGQGWRGHCLLNREELGNSSIWFRG